MLKALAFSQHITDTQCRDHPVLYGVFSQHFFIPNVIFVAILTVAFDVNAKHILYGALMAIECCATHLHATAHVCLYPTGVEIAERNCLGIENGFHQPDIFFK